MNIVSTQYTLSNKAFEIYVSGCDGSCKGCHNYELRDYSLGEDFKTVLPNIISKIKDSSIMIDNIWILGGEPLLQDIDELDYLISELKKLGKKIWLFTRFEIDDVINIYNNYKLLDYIKCGKYDCDKLTNNNIQFGIKLASRNQRIIKVGEVNGTT